MAIPSIPIDIQARRRHLGTVPMMASAVIKLRLNWTWNSVFLFFTLTRSINTSEGVSETVQYFLDRLYTNRYQPSWNPMYVITILKEVCPIDCGILRISIHMLISHYNALLGEAQTLTGWADSFVHRCGVLCSVHWPSMIYQAWLGQLIRPVTS